MVGALGGVEHWEGGRLGELVGAMEGVEFSSQGHFHTLQVLNVPQFLFCRAVRLKTAPRGNFSHT